MSSFLYLSIHTSLTEEEKSLIDEEVLKNQSSLIFPLKKFARKTKKKAKRLGLGVLISIQVLGPIGQLSAVILPVPGPVIERIYSSTYPSSINSEKLQAAPVIPPVPSKIQLSYLRKSNSELISELDDEFLETLLELRAGGGLENLLAVFLYIILYYGFQKGLISADAFGVPQNNPVGRVVPFLDPLGCWTGSSTRPYAGQRSYDQVVSRFDHKYYSRLAMSSSSRDQNGFVMTREKAIELISETYSSLPTQMINDGSGYQVSAWRAATHIYHSNGLGVKPADFGITQAQLEKMKGGLINYVQRGEPLPSAEHVRAYQSALVKNCELAPETRDDTMFFDKTGSREVRSYVNKEKRVVILLDKDTKDLITGDKFKPAKVDQFVEENIWGPKKSIEKWSKE